MEKQSRRARRELEKRKTKRLVDEPKAQSEGDKADKSENIEPAGDIPLSNLPTHTGYPQTEKANYTAKYGKQVVRALVAVPKTFFRIFSFLLGRFVRLLDRHQGSITALAAIGIAVLTLYYVRYSKRQWEAMRGQLAEMRKDQRAWLYATEGSRPLLVVGRALPAVVNLTDTGKTPATKVYAEIYVEVVPNGASPHFENGGMRSIQETGLILPNTVPEFKGVPLSVWRWRYKFGGKPHEGEPYPLAQTEFDSLSRGDSWIALHGIVRYQDVFHVDHWTKFCFWSNELKVGSYTAQSCTAYNSTDDN